MLLRPRTTHFFPTRLNVITPQQSEDAQRRGRDEARKTYRHASRIDGMKAVHVFPVVNGHDDFLLINVLWQWQLHDKAIHVFVFIQPVYAPQEFFFGDICLVSNQG